MLLALWASVVCAQEITLNLKDADINALITTVSEATGRNFIVDPRVKGKVTVVSSQPMQPEELYQVFLSVLQVHGFSAVPAGEVVKIVPDVNAKQSGIPNVTGREPGRGDEMVTRVVQVDNVSAAQLVPILRPLVPQQGHLAAYPATNVLIMSDRADNIQRMVEIIQRIDKVSDSELEVISLEHASAGEVVRVLTSLVRAGAGAAAKQVTGEQAPVLVADERTNSVLMSGERSQRLRLRTIIAHLDTPLERGGNTQVIYLRYARAADLVEVLRGVGDTQSKEAAKSQAAGERPVFDIQADEATNALVVTAPPDVMRSLKAVISQLDVRRAQVLVEAIIAEVKEDKARELGVQWIFEGASDGSGPVGIINFSNIAPSIAQVASGIAGGDLGAVSASAGTTVGAGRTNSDSFNFAALLKALASDSDTNLVSTPTLITLDNEEAEIVIGQNVPFVTGQFTNTGASGGATNPFQTIQREDVGTTLKIKPQINEGDALKLDIEQEVSSLSDSAEASDVVTNKRSIKTSVMVDDGQVVVLGGLMQDDLRDRVQKVPLLGDLPLLGRLFRANDVTKTKTNLMVFIRPVILRDNAALARYTSGKYNFIRTKQLENRMRGIDLLPGEEPPLMPELEMLRERGALGPLSGERNTPAGAAAEETQ